MIRQIRNKALKSKIRSSLISSARSYASTDILSTESFASLLIFK